MKLSRPRGCKGYRRSWQSASEFWCQEGLPPRLANALARANLGSWRDLEGWSDRELLALPNVGPVGLATLHRLQTDWKREEALRYEFLSPEDLAEQALDELAGAMRALRSIL